MTKKQQKSAANIFDRNPYDGVEFKADKPMPSLRNYPCEPMRTHPADASGPRPADFDPLDRGGLPGNKY